MRSRKVRLATSWGAIVFSFKFDFDLNFVLKISFIHIGLKFYAKYQPMPGSGQKVCGGGRNQVQGAHWEIYQYPPLSKINKYPTNTDYFVQIAP